MIGVSKQNQKKSGGKRRQVLQKGDNGERWKALSTEPAHQDSCESLSLCRQRPGECLVLKPASRWGLIDMFKSPGERFWLEDGGCCWSGQQMTLQEPLRLQNIEHSYRKITWDKNLKCEVIVIKEGRTKWWAWDQKNLLIEHSKCLKENCRKFENAKLECVTHNKPCGESASKGRGNHTLLKAIAFPQLTDCYHRPTQPECDSPWLFFLPYVLRMKCLLLHWSMCVFSLSQFP